MVVTAIAIVSPERLTTPTIIINTEISIHALPQKGDDDRLVHFNSRD